MPLASKAPLVKDENGIFGVTVSKGRLVDVYRLGDLYAEAEEELGIQ